MTISLLQFTHSGSATFSLALSNTHGFDCAEIVRCVPGKRLVCRGIWDQQSVYAKLFIGNKAKRYAERDLRGVQALARAGIPTPSLLHAGSIADEPHARGNVGEVLIFAAVPESVNAEQAWGSLQKQETRFSLAKSLVTEVARHHCAGLIQTDLYLKNFLLQGKKIYTLDGDAIRTITPMFRRHQELENLALLLSKFDVSDEAVWLPELLEIYAKERGWSGAPNPDDMCQRVSAHRRRVISQYADKKVFRQCSDIQVEKNVDFFLTRAFLAVAHQYASADLRRALAAPDTLLDEVHSHRLKSGHTCTVSLAEVDGRKVVVKRYNIKSFWHGLSRALRLTRAALSWSSAHRLMMYGIATAAPIALLEKRYGMIRRQAYFLAEYVAAPDVAEFFGDAAEDAERKVMVAENIARMFYKLQLLKIAHGDFKAGNMKIVDGQPLLIDLDSMHEYRCNWLFTKRHLRDLRRFMRNWQHDAAITNTLAVAFRAEYKDVSLLDKAGI